MYMVVYMHVYIAPHACMVPWRTEEDLRSLGIGDTVDGPKLPRGC